MSRWFYFCLRFEKSSLIFALNTRLVDGLSPHGRWTWEVWSVVVQHPPTPLDATQATGEMGVLVLIKTTALHNRTSGRSNSKTSLVCPAPCSQLWMQYLGHRTHQRGSSWVDISFVSGSLLYLTAGPQVVSYEWHGPWIFAKDSSPKILNWCPQTLDFSARGWVLLHRL